MRTLLIAAALSILSAGAALACSCREYTSAAEQAADADALFRGRAIATRAAEGVWSITTFEVTAPLKLRDDARNDAGLVEVRHHAGSTAACGIEFEQGQETLVAAHGARGMLFTNYCAAPRFSETAYRRALNLPPN